MEKIKHLGAYAAGVFLLTVAGIVGMAGAASAQTVDPVSAAFDDMQSKILNYGGLFIGLVVVATGLALGIRWLRKAKSA